MCLIHNTHIAMKNTILAIKDLLQRGLEENNWDHVESALSIMEELESSDGYDSEYYSDDDDYEN